MVAGRYDPQIAIAVGYTLGDPLGDEEDGTDALKRFIHAAMSFYDEALRKKLAKSIKEENVRRLAQLQDVTEEEITVLAGWDKYLAREFLREVDKMLRAMGWREAVVVTARAQQPEAVVNHGMKRDRKGKQHGQALQ